MFTKALQACRSTQVTQPPSTCDDCFLPQEDSSEPLRLCGVLVVGAPAAAIQALRDKVALEIERAWHEDAMVANVLVRDLVIASEMSLDSYVSKTRKSQWGSKVEIDLACRALQVEAVYVDDMESACVGAGRRVGIVSLRHSHFYALKGRLPKKPAEQGTMLRGGMPRRLPTSLMRIMEGNPEADRRECIVHFDASPLGVTVNSTPKI